MVNSGCVECILGHSNEPTSVGLSSGFMLQSIPHGNLQSEEGGFQGHLSR